MATSTSDTPCCASDTNDPEESLLNALSALASFSEPVLSDSSSRIVSWIWSLFSNESPPPEQIDPETTEEQWKARLESIAVLLPTISPLDVHAAAVQAMVFSDSSMPYYVCLLLCAHALLRCNTTTMGRRFKRWRSLLCETIALYQRHVLLAMEEEEDGIDNDESILLWVNHVLPSCRHVESDLPDQVNRIPIMTGMVATASRLIVAAEQHHYQTLLDSIQPMSMTQVWYHPWRRYDATRNEFDLAYWTLGDCHDEDVLAGMDTTWDSVGISLLAWTAFDQRPLVYAPKYVWTLWFPHAAILLHEFTDKDAFVLKTLQLLVDQTPRGSLEFQETSVDSPIGTLQLLLNRISVSAPQVMQCIQDLLALYQPSAQVNIITILATGCPHQAMIPRLLDLLRPIALEAACYEYLLGHVRDLEVYVENGNLVNVPQLLAQVEVYTAVVSMVYMRLRQPQVTKTTGLDEFKTLVALFKALREALQQWSANDSGPEEYFRLYLLEDALQQVVTLLENE